MSCSCVYVDDGDYERPEFVDERVVEARKKHVCTECRREIVPGEKYERASGKWDGCIETYKTCMDCISVRDAFFCGSYGYSAIWQDLYEHILCGPVDVECLVALTPAAREKVCDMIEESWEE